MLRIRLFGTIKFRHQFHLFTQIISIIFTVQTWADPEGGEQGVRPPPSPWNCQIFCFCHVEIFRQTPSGNLDPPSENFLDPRMPNTISQNFFFNIITSLANIFSTGNSWIFFQFRFSFYLCDNFLNVTE